MPAKARSAGRLAALVLIIAGQIPGFFAGEAAAPAHEEKAAGAGSARRGPPPRIPDVVVRDQHGRKLRFYTDLVRGRTVAINVVFTTCTTTCPLLTATFRKVQEVLGDRVGRDVALVSITADPVTDVPERLRAYAARFGAGPGWTFVTGSKPEIDRLLAALGAAGAEAADHSPMVLVGNDRTGYWTRVHGLAPPATVASVLVEAAAGGDRAAPASAADATRATAAGVAAVARHGKASAAARYFPNVVLRAQDDRPVRFYDDLLAGRIVLINVMDTGCSGVCSPATFNLARVQASLGERVGRDVVMLSISVDPATDTPAVLKRYAERHGAGPGWYVLTGRKADVDRALSKLGSRVEDPERHNGILVIGNEATGEWMKTFVMARPEQIAGAVLRLLAPGAGGRGGG